MGRVELEAVLEEFIEELKALVEELKDEKQQTPKDGLLSTRTLVELADHEGVVLEAYKDVRGIWTWGVGVTTASGHAVERYIDAPTTLKRVFEVYEWLLRTKYLPDVLKAFEGYELSEHELAAALSFHYNTGGIKRAQWVKSIKQGLRNRAYDEFMNWRSPASIIPRREKERDLFFNGEWANKDGKVTIYSVLKPSYRPAISSGKRIEYKGA